ncbi:uncharacterized protein LOC112492781 isoform X1 [Ziziphus jujuba]|uniref:Uncharacterized protein LOC112492781 isoform X1 n=1 Tax=Ziziphus jujuba TaxID=326968 RepID=A0ABM4AH97_ZIZJJ|nr:uncharacterized protein LOC112492781 isoform X1 [Ziziphus jujuba]
MRSIGGPCMLKSLTRLCRFDDVGTLFLLKEHFRQKGTGIWISRLCLLDAHYSNTCVSLGSISSLIEWCLSIPNHSYIEILSQDNFLIGLGRRANQKYRGASTSQHIPYS